MIRAKIRGKEIRQWEKMRGKEIRQWVNMIGSLLWAKVKKTHRSSSVVGKHNSTRCKINTSILFEIFIYILL